MLRHELAHVSRSLKSPSLHPWLHLSILSCPESWMVISVGILGLWPQFSLPAISSALQHTLCALMPSEVCVCESARDNQRGVVYHDGN